MTCPNCGAENEPMGTLGKMVHYRCRDCGLEYHAPDEYDPAEDADSELRAGYVDPDDLRGTVTPTHGASPGTTDPAAWAAYGGGDRQDCPDLSDRHAWAEDRSWFEGVKATYVVDPDGTVTRYRRGVRVSMPKGR